MKILHLGLTCCESPENGFMSALREAASEYREVNPSNPDFNQIARTYALEMYSPLEPTLIFMQIQAPDILDSFTAGFLPTLGFVMNFTGDVRHTIPDWMVTIGRSIHLTLFSNVNDVETAKSLGLKADFLNYAIDPKRYNIHNIVKPAPKIVAHMNNYGPEAFPLSKERIEAVIRLEKEFGKDFGVAGTGWMNSVGNFNSNQVEESIHYNNAQIAISISHFNYDRYASDRLFRALASGVFVLSHHFKGIEKDFIPGVHLATFSNLDEMIDKCHYYLNHEQERLKIAKAGYDIAHKNFTFKAMVQNIIKLHEIHSK